MQEDDDDRAASADDEEEAVDEGTKYTHAKRAPYPRTPISTVETTMDAPNFGQCLKAYLKDQLPPQQARSLQINGQTCVDVYTQAKRLLPVISSVSNYGSGGTTCISDAKRRRESTDLLLYCPCIHDGLGSCCIEPDCATVGRTPDKSSIRYVKCYSASTDVTYKLTTCLLQRYRAQRM